MTTTHFNSPIGLTIYNNSEDDIYTITGTIPQDVTIRRMESAYDLEELIKKKIQHVGIEFDSEHSQFFAYAKNKDLAIQFVKNCEDYFKKVRDMLY